MTSLTIDVVILTLTHHSSRIRIFDHPIYKECRIAVDIVAAAENADDITWWHNDGSPLDGGWTELTVSGTFDGERSVYTTDLDGDGDLDILGAAYNGGDILWWANEANDTLPADGSPTSISSTDWMTYTINRAFNGATSVSAADIDGDGDQDVVGAAEVSGSLLWWENEANDTLPAEANDTLPAEANDTLPAEANDTLPAEANDTLPADGSPTIVTGDDWILHGIDVNFTGASSIYAVDLDKDGDVDLLGAGTSGISWWEGNNGAGWTEHSISNVLTNTAFSVRVSFASVYAADLDNDGDLDVVGAGSDQISWWANGLKWSKVVQTVSLRHKLAAYAHLKTGG